MLTYEYTCNQCSINFERWRPFAEADQSAVCPSCGGEGRKLYSLFASEGCGKVCVPEGEPFRAT